MESFCESVTHHSVLEDDRNGVRCVDPRIPHAEYREYDSIFCRYVEFMKIVAVTLHVVYLQAQQVYKWYLTFGNFLARAELVYLCSVLARCVQDRKLQRGAAVHSGGQLRVATYMPASQLSPSRRTS